MASIAIWPRATIPSLILMPLFTSVSGIWAVLFYFILPNVAIIASALFIGELDFLKALVSLFKKSNQHQAERAEHDKKHASSSMLTSTVVYRFIGLLFCIFFDAVFFKMIRVISIIGFAWGFNVYQLFQNNFFDPYERFWCDLRCFFWGSTETKWRRSNYSVIPVLVGKNLKV